MSTAWADAAPSRIATIAHSPEPERDVHHVPAGHLVGMVLEVSGDGEAARPWEGPERQRRVGLPEDLAGLRP